MKSLSLLASVFILKAQAFSPNSSTASVQLLANPFPYEFPDLSANSRFPMDSCHGVTLEEATTDQLQDYMRQGILSSVKIVECYLRRKLQVDQYLNSILELNPDVMEIAASLDVLRANGIVLSPLHGIPFVVKDNIATQDKMETTAGSYTLMGSVVPRDAHVVRKLREAGAILLGKAGMSEWADMRTNYYSEGYSARGGQVRAPYNLSSNPGGSSSGSGSAVGANLVMFSLGTETDGSIISPAESSGLVGIKPTVGLTSRSGIIPESIHQDTVGPLARTVRDATYALEIMVGIDERDNYTAAQQVPAGGYTQFLSGKGALQGAVFGLPWESFWTLAEQWMVDELLEVLDLIEDAGGTIVNGTELPHWQTIVSPAGWDWDYGTTRGYPNESEYTIVKVDFYNNIKSYLSELKNTDIRSLEDIVAYNNLYTGSEGGIPNTHPAFQSGQDGFLASLKTKGEMDETYWQALEFCQRTTREEGIDAALTWKGKKLDGLLVPSSVDQTYQIAAQAGYPMITLPVGLTPQNTPFGLSIMNTAWSEPSLVKYGSAIEDMFLQSQPSPTTGLKRGRTLPMFHEHLARNIPIQNDKMEVSGWEIPSEPIGRIKEIFEILNEYVFWVGFPLTKGDMT